MKTNKVLEKSDVSRHLKSIAEELPTITDIKTSVMGLLDPLGTKPPIGFSKFRQLCFFFNQSGPFGIPLLLALLTGGGLGIAHSNFYNQHINEVKTGKPSYYRVGEDGELSITEHNCLKDSELFGLGKYICFPEYSTIRKGEYNKELDLQGGNFSHAKNFSLNIENIPTESEIQQLVLDLKEFIEKYPENINIEINGFASPEGENEKSLSGQDNLSLNKNTKLAETRAIYIKENLRKYMPEIDNVILTIKANVERLNEEDLSRMKEIAEKSGVHDIQKFLISFNENKTLNISNEDQKFIKSKLFRGVKVKVNGENKNLGISILKIGSEELFIERVIVYLIALIGINSFTQISGRIMTIKSITKDRRKGKISKTEGFKRSMLGILNSQEANNLFLFIKNCPINTKININIFGVHTKTINGLWEDGYGKQYSDLDFVGYLEGLSARQEINLDLLKTPDKLLIL